MRGTVSVWDEKVLGTDGAGVLDGGDGCTAGVNVLRATELYS